MEQGGWCGLLCEERHGFRDSDATQDRLRQERYALSSVREFTSYCVPCSPQQSSSVVVVSSSRSPEHEVVSLQAGVAR